jgi:hypothetical protein
MTALAMKQKGLKPAAKIVLYWLADHHNSETGACFPSLAKLANECEMDVATVKRHLVRLEQDGLIKRSQRTRENGSQTSTQYILLLDDNLAQNAPAPSANCATPLAQNNTPHNLVINNLGNEPSIFDAFNEIAEGVGWPKVQARTQKRERMVAARIKDCGGFDNWKSAMERAAASDFLSGKATGSTPASFDWLNNASNFAKLMEGNYDNRTDNKRNSASDSEARILAFAGRTRAPSEPDWF